MGMQVMFRLTFPISGRQTGYERETLLVGYICKVYIQYFRVIASSNQIIC
jgi:hypothetical protein